LKGFSGSGFLEAGKYWPGIILETSSKNFLKGTLFSSGLITFLGRLAIMEDSILPFFKKYSFTASAPKPTIANANGTIGLPSTANASKGLPPR
jgi:hypothetical protein